MHGSPLSESKGGVPTPLYYRVWDDIHSRIRAGELKPGDPLPPERELQVQYGVSRTTVRMALRDLEEQGLIVRQQGRGTTVARPKSYRQLGWLTMLSEDLGRTGLLVEPQFLEMSAVPAPQEVADALGIPVRGQVWRLWRRRLVSGEPVAVDEMYLLDWVAARFAGDDLHAPSILRVLERVRGISLVEADYRIEAALPSRRIAELLEIAPEAPVLVVTRTTYTEGRAAIEYGRTWYRADRIGYTGHVQNRPLEEREADDRPDGPAA